MTRSTDAALIAQMGAGGGGSTATTDYLLVDTSNLAFSGHIDPLTWSSVAVSQGTRITRDGSDHTTIHLNAPGIYAVQPLFTNNDGVTYDDADFLLHFNDCFPLPDASGGLGDSYRVAPFGGRLATSPPFIVVATADTATIQMAVYPNGAVAAFTSSFCTLGVAAISGLAGADGRDGTDGTDGTDGAPGAPGAPGADGVVQSVVAGTGISVDDSDPANPVVSADGGGGGVATINPRVNLYSPLGSAGTQTAIVAQGDGNGYDLTITSLPILCPAGTGFDVRIEVPHFDSGVLGIGSAMLTVTNQDGTECAALLTTGYRSLSSDEDDNPFLFDIKPTIGASAGTDLTADDPTTPSELDTTAGGVFTAQIVIHFQGT